MNLKLVVLTLIIGFGIVSILPVVADEQPRMQFLDDAYYNLTWVSSAAYYTEPAVLPDGEYPTDWRVNKAYIDDTGFNAVGLMRAMNQSFDVSQMDRKHNLEVAVAQYGGKIVRISDVTIPTIKGNKTGQMAFGDTGLGMLFVYGEVFIDDKEIVVFIAREDKIDFLSSVGVGGTMVS